MNNSNTTENPIKTAANKLTVTEVRQQKKQSSTNRWHNFFTKIADNLALSMWVNFK